MINIWSTGLRLPQAQCVSVTFPDNNYPIIRWGNLYDTFYQDNESNNIIVRLCPALLTRNLGWDQLDQSLGEARQIISTSEKPLTFKAKQFIHKCRADLLTGYFECYKETMFRWSPLVSFLGILQSEARTKLNSISWGGRRERRGKKSGHPVTQ